jgi:hypothetical protein
VRAGTVALWIAVLLLSACAAQPPVLVSAGGRIHVENAAGEAIEVFARGDRVARLADGADVHLDRLPLGDCSLEARGDRTGWRMGTTVRLEPSTEASWVVRASDEHAQSLRNLPTGRVRFVNHTAEPIRAFIDDAARDLVWPAGEADYAGLTPGRHHLRAEGTKTSFKTGADVEVSVGAESRFDVVVPRAALRVANRSGTAARVSVRDEAERMVKAGLSATFGNLPAGTADVSARDDQGRLLWSGAVPLVIGEVVDAVIPAPDGVVSILSDVAYPVSVWIDGTNLGLCASTGAAEFKGLPVGRVHAEALNPEGRVVAKTSLVLSRGSPILWMIREGDTSGRRGDDGSVAIENATAEPLRIQIDGWDRGEVLPGLRRVVPGLLPGPHAVAVVGLRSRDVLRADVDVPGGGQATWTARSRTAGLALRNDRVEEVRVKVDGETTALLAPAQTLELSLPAGPHKVEAVGVMSLRSTLHALVLPTASLTRLALPSPDSTLVVTNRRSEPLALADGDRHLGVILPGDRVTLRDILPGDHLLEARSLDRPLSWHVKVALVAGDSFAWDLGD